MTAVITLLSVLDDVTRCRTPLCRFRDRLAVAQLFANGTVGERAR